MDLSDVTGVNILTGDNIVCYKIVAEVDSPIKEVKASYGGVEAVTSLDKKSRLINVYFGSDPVDFTQVQVEFVISAISSMVDPTSTNLTMDLSADTTYVKVQNDLVGTATYKMICWNDPSDNNLAIKRSADVEVTDNGGGSYTLNTTGYGSDRLYVDVPGIGRFCGFVLVQGNQSDRSPEVESGCE